MTEVPKNYLLTINCVFAKGVRGNVNYTHAILMHTIYIIFLFVLQKIRPTSAIENEVTTLTER